MLIDQFGRKITYMRVSVTDRCNMRCVYCMPPDGMDWKCHDQIMTFEEITAVIRAAASQGVRSVRLTGGEPLVRKGIVDLVRMIAQIPGIDDISLTTNAVLLEKFAPDLADAGLKRVNISIDTLKPERFTRITRGGSIENLWRGVEAAEKYGLTPIKFNTVAMRGVNDDEIVDIASLSLRHPWHMRFIELMPINNQQPWGDGFPPPEQAYFSVQEIRQLLEPLGLTPVEKKNGRGPAREFCLSGAIGTIGLISPLGEHFCATCNRLRLTSDGNLRMCLLNDLEVPILNAIRAGESILPYLQRAVDLKPERHEVQENHLPEERNMSEVGG